MAIACSDDMDKAWLADKFPGWDVWYVQRTGQPIVWCARPSGAPVGTHEAPNATALEEVLGLEERLRQP
jgi:hypothetical protein